MIIQNAVKITENYPEELFLVSAHRHDYNTYTFKNGETISVDGGGSYIKRSGCGATLKGCGTHFVEWCLDDKEPFEVIKSKLLWGSRGKDGKSPLKYVLLSECDTNHLQAILTTQTLSPIYKKVIQSMLDDRNVKLKRKIVKNNLYGKIGKPIVKQKKIIRKRENKILTKYS